MAHAARAAHRQIGQGQPGRMASGAWHNGRMAAATLVSVEEYLATSYEPDCDYVDGELEDRNVGRKSHAKAQSNLHLALRIRYPSLFVVVEQRIRVSGPAKSRRLSPNGRQPYLGRRSPRTRCGYLHDFRHTRG